MSAPSDRELPLGRLDGFMSALPAQDGRPALDAGGRIIHPAIVVGAQAAQPQSVVEWRVEDDFSCCLTLSAAMQAPDRIRYFGLRMSGFWPLMEAYYRAGAPARGWVNISLDDHAVGPGLSFCGKDPRNFLVPDPVFVKTRGYAQTREQLAAGVLPWAQRKRRAVWRGATTGRRHGGTWRALPRAQLCQLSVLRPGLLDAAFTNVVQLPAEVEAELREAGLMGDRMPAHAFAQWRYQVDIDGNSNSWPGLFQKLLSGSTVLKVASPMGWKQWYYDRMLPWVHYVPVEADMRDLIEKIVWLRQNDDAAAEIAAAGTAFAVSLTYEAEVEQAVATIAAAINAAGRG